MLKGTLSERIKLTDSVMKQVANSNEIEIKHRSLVAAENELNQSINVAKVYASSIKTLKKHQSALFDYDNLDNEIAQISELESLGYITVKQIKDIKDAIVIKDTILKNKWKEYVTQRTLNMINTLKTLNKVLKNPKITLLINGLESLQNIWPVREDVIVNLSNLSKEYQELLKELKLNDDIKSFITKLSLNHATLSDITNDILVWLKENGLIDKAFIQLRY